SAGLPKGIPSIPFIKIEINWQPNKNINTPITDELKSPDKLDPNPVNPMTIVIIPDIITPTAKLPPKTERGISCAAAATTSVKNTPHHKPDCPSIIARLCPNTA